MSNDETPEGPVAPDRREAVREKAQQVHARQSRARFLSRTGIVLGSVIAVGAIGLVVTWTVTSAMSQPMLTPANMQGDGIVVDAIDSSLLSGAGSADGAIEEPAPTPTESAAPADDEQEPSATPTQTAQPVEIRIYVDYLSSTAGDFEAANAAQLGEWVDEGAATLTYHPVALLTSKSNGTKYSLRAASAAACVVTHAPESFFGFNHALLTDQPEVDSDGLTDDELADLALAVGSEQPKVVRSCIENEDFLAWAKDATERALEEELPQTEGVSLTGTPMVLVNGQPYVGALDDPAEFSQFVLALSSDAYYSTPTPEPETSESAKPTTSPEPTETTSPKDDASNKDDGAPEE